MIPLAGCEPAGRTPEPFFLSPWEVTVSEQRVIAFPETRHSSLVLHSAKQVSAEPQYPHVPCRTCEHHAKIPEPAAASAIPRRGAHGSPRPGCGTAKPFPGPRQRRVPHRITEPRRGPELPRVTAPSGSGPAPGVHGWGRVCSGGGQRGPCLCRDARREALAEGTYPHRSSWGPACPAHRLCQCSQEPFCISRPSLSGG